MTPDEHSPSERPGEPSGAEPRDPVGDFFAAERAGIGDLPGDEARWLEITRRADRPRRAGWLRYAAAAAAVVVLGGSAWAVGAHRGGGSLAAGRPSVTQTVYVNQVPAPAPSPGVATAPVASVSSVSSVPLDSSTAPTAPNTAAGTVPPVPADFAVVSVSTVSDGRLFALGRATCDGRPCALVATSSDGGATWSLRGQLPGVTVASRASSGGALTRTADTVSDVRFASDSVGWAFGATVLRTTDGGLHWSTYRHVGGAAVLDVETDGTDVVLTTAATCQGVVCSGPVTVLRAPATASSASRAGDLGGVLDAGQGVTAADIGWFAGKAIITVTGGAGLPAQVLRTDGLHPIAVMGCADAGATRLLTPSSGTALLALCPPQGAAGQLGFGLSVSGDGGVTWTSVTSTGPSVSNAGTVAATASDPNHLLVVSGGSADAHPMTVSSDGGLSWHDPASPPPLPGRGWTWVGSPGAGTFYAVPTDPAGGFWRSIDGGETWTSVLVVG